MFEVSTISEHCFRQWLGAVGQEAIIWTKVDITPYDDTRPQWVNLLIPLYGMQSLYNRCEFLLYIFSNFWPHVDSISLVNLGWMPIITHYMPLLTAIITMTSYWAWRRLKSQASRIFTQTFIQAQMHERKHQSSASLVFVRGIHRWPVNSPHKKASNAENTSIWWRHYGMV